MTFESYALFCINTINNKIMIIIITINIYIIIVTTLQCTKWIRSFENGNWITRVLFDKSQRKLVEELILIDPGKVHKKFYCFCCVVPLLLQDFWLFRYGSSLGFASSFLLSFTSFNILIWSIRSGICQSHVCIRAWGVLNIQQIS